MEKEISLYNDLEINRAVKLDIIQENLFLENNLSKNIFPNSVLYFEKDYHVLKPSATVINEIVVDELLQICSSLMPETYCKEGDGILTLYSCCSYNNFKFSYLNDEHFQVLKVLMESNKDSPIEIYFTPFEDYKHMASKVVRYMQNTESCEYKIDFFLSKSL